jgi:hypothetical protein
MSKIILPTNKWFTSIFLLSNNSVKTGTKPYWNIPFLWDKILDEINFHNEIFSTSSSFFSLFSEINRKRKNKKKKTKYKFLPSLFFISRTLKGFSHGMELLEKCKIFLFIKTRGKKILL